MSENWIGGTYEAGADDDQAASDHTTGDRGGTVPGGDTGVGVGQGAPSTFEPEEDEGGGQPGSEPPD